MILISFLLLTRISRAEAEALQTQLDRLLSGDPSVIPALVEQKESALPQLLQRLTPSPEEINTLLNQLGAETYQERSEATSALSQMGSQIRGNVTTHLTTHSSDPEVVKRCRQILAAITESINPDRDTIIVKFFIACEEVDPEFILRVQERYKRIFNQKNSWIFTQNDAEDLAEFHVFVLHYLEIPEARPSFFKWLLNDKHKDRTLGTVRMLLQQDFDAYYYTVTGKNRYTREIDRLIGEEFSERLADENVMLAKLKRLYDAPRQEAEVEFNPREPITPLKAYHIMNREDMNRLDAVYYDMLFEKMAPLPKAELLSLMTEKRLSGFFLQQIAQRRPDLQEELPGLILAKVDTIDWVWLWDVYMMVLVNDLNYEPKRGEFDEQWKRVFEIQTGSATVLSWRADDLRISPDLVLSMYRLDEKKAEENFDTYASAFVYVLENANMEVREQAIDMLLRFSELEPLDYHMINKIWSALIADTQTQSPELLDKILQVMEKLQSRKDSHFLSTALKNQSAKDRDQRLLDFYRSNQQPLDAIFAEIPLKESAFQTVCLLTKTQDLPEESIPVLKSALQSSLLSESLTPKNLQSALTAGLNLGGIQNDLWFESLLDLMETGEVNPFDFPIWLLDAQYSGFLPQLEKRLDDDGVSVAPTLCLGLMIDPDHPGINARVEELLQQQGSAQDIAFLVEAMKILNREPDLALLEPARLTELFDLSDKDVFKGTTSLIQEVDLVSNRQTALETLAPHFPDLFENKEMSTHTLSELYFRNPKSYDLVGETLLTLMETGSERVVNAASGSFTSLSNVPASAAPRLGSLLEKTGTSLNTENSLLWSIAKMGSRAASLTEQIRAFSAVQEKSMERKAFALAAVSQDPKERQENLRYLMSQYQEKPNQYILRQIGLINGFDQERLQFFQGLLEKGYREEGKEVSVSNLYEIVYRLTNFEDPEIAVRAYKDILRNISDPQMERTEMRNLAGPVFRRLGAFYPQRLEEFKPLIAALPATCRKSWEYRYLMERMK